MIITITGKAGAGKDTAAVYAADLVHHVTDKDCAITRFSEPIKAAALAVFGPNFDLREHKEVEVEVPTWLLTDQAMGMCRTLGVNASAGLITKVFLPYLRGTTSVISPRRYQQLLGTEIARASGPDIFVQHVVAKCTGHTVVTDARFKNETAIADVRLFVYRPDLSEVSEHESERLASVLHELRTFRAWHDLPYIKHDGLVYYVLDNTHGYSHLNQEVANALQGRIK